MKRLSLAGASSSIYPDTPLGLKQAMADPRVRMKCAKSESLAGPNANSDSADLFTLTGAGVINSITYIIGAKGLAYDGLLDIYLNGDASPTIRLRLCDLLLFRGNMDYSSTAAYDQANVKIGNAKFFTDNYELEYAMFNTYGSAAISGIRVCLRYPIPYSNGARMVIHNGTATDYRGQTNNWCMCEYTNDVASSLRFRAASLPTIDGSAQPSSDQNVNYNATSDFLSLSAGNAGWIAGLLCIAISQGNSAGSDAILERDLFAYRDGEGTASFQTSGFEDAFDTCFFNSYEVKGNTRHAFVSMFRPGSAGTKQTLWCSFKDWLGSIGGISFSNGVTLRSEVQPDLAAGRITSAAAPGYHTTVFYYLR